MGFGRSPTSLIDLVRSTVGLPCRDLPEGAEHARTAKPATRQTCMSPQGPAGLDIQKMVGAAGFEPTTPSPPD